MKRDSFKLWWHPPPQRRPRWRQPMPRAFARVRPIAFYRTGALIHLVVNERWLWTWVTPALRDKTDRQIAAEVPDHVRAAVAEALAA